MSASHHLILPGHPGGQRGLACGGPPPRPAHPRVRTARSLPGGLAASPVQRRGLSSASLAVFSQLTGEEPARVNSFSRGASCPSRTLSPEQRWPGTRGQTAPGAVPKGHQASNSPQGPSPRGLGVRQPQGPSPRVTKRQTAPRGCPQGDSGSDSPQGQGAGPLLSAAPCPPAPLRPQKDHVAKLPTPTSDPRVSPGTYPGITDTSC